MSVSLSTLRFNIRNLYGDTSMEQNKVAVQTYELDRSIVNNMDDIIGGLRQPPAWVTWLTATAGDSDVEVAATAGGFHSAAVFRWTTAGTIVDKVSAEQLESLRVGTSTSSGDPVCLALVEAVKSAGTPRAMYVKFWPTPARATDTLQALLSEFPAEPSAAADAIPLSRLAIRALEWRVAAEQITRLSDEWLGKLGVNRVLAGLYEQKAMRALANERGRTATLRKGYPKLNGSMP